MNELRELISELINERDGDKYYSRHVPPNTLRWQVDEAMRALAAFAARLAEPKPAPQSRKRKGGKP